MNLPWLYALPTLFLCILLLKYPSTFLYLNMLIFPASPAQMLTDLWIMQNYCTRNILLPSPCLTLSFNYLCVRLTLETRGYKPWLLTRGSSKACRNGQIERFLKPECVCESVFLATQLILMWPSGKKQNNHRLQYRVRVFISMLPPPSVPVVSHQMNARYIYVTERSTHPHTHTHSDVH